MKINWTKLKNKIPSKVKIGKRYYEVLWSVELDKGETLGETRFDTPQIIISKKLSPKQAVSCFYHECLHALSYEYLREIEAELTEKQVLALEQSFVSINNLILELNS